MEILTDIYTDYQSISIRTIHSTRKYQRFLMGIIQKIIQ